MEEKLISVIVPVYNVEKYLDKCVESIVNQTYKNLEIILVDDGSPDNCSEKCDDWAEKDNRVKVIHKQNGGLSDARNAGYAIATGEYISFIDSDDYIEQNFYELLANELDNGADIAECATRLCDENNETILVRGFDSNKVLDSIAATQTLLKERGIMQTVWNKLYKRKCIENIMFEKGKYHEDNFWTWQVFLNADKVSVISQPMYNYVQRKSGIMGAGYSLKRLDALEADYLSYCALKDDDNYKKIVVNRFAGACLFQMQSVIKNLDEKNKDVAITTILDYLNKSQVSKEKHLLNSKWYILFIQFPKSIAKIRAMLGMGF